MPTGPSASPGCPKPKAQQRVVMQMLEGVLNQASR